jgi:hypothetical protein
MSDLCLATYPREYLLKLHNFENPEILHINRGLDQPDYIQKHIRYDVYSLARACNSHRAHLQSNMSKICHNSVGLQNPVYFQNHINLCHYGFEGANSFNLSHRL